MSDPHTPDWYDRSLEKSLTNNLVDRYFSDAESWLRAILRMCIFSLTYTDRQAALLIECPNQAVAKRLSRKIYPLQDFVQRMSRRSRASKRVLICYLDDTLGSWRCFDTKTNAWKDLKTCQVPTLGNW
ncbi:MAG TPA: hypothetical protein DDW76_09810 [Cyanobacteria bacterium UBA11369]|nr:hypothetical protein [Cyanobacteria bacterium UBA11371]HBE33423.1 hypothetical protein [Cyanobacteria bacterium UBA11368]HBE49068.1 hypothetical protein [Cyanobacteria bacterium UBA11369]